MRAEARAVPGSNHHRSSILWILLCSLITIVPLLLHGPSCGHDFDFHLLSWLETSHDWHHRLLDPQWLASANYGAGEPRFIFYPPASWLLGALLGSGASLVTGQASGWTLAPILFTLLSTFAAGLCVYLLAQSLASRGAATVAACLFVANPYLLFVAYERTAYGELLATALVALLVYLSLIRSIPVVALAMVVAGLWLTNAPSAVMGCYTLACISLLRLVSERAWRNAGRATAACLLGLALAGFYLVPAVWQQRWVQIDRAVSSGMRVEDSFLFTHTGQQYHDQVLHSASMLTVILMGAGFVAFAFARLRPARKSSSPAWIFAVLLFVLLLLQFRFSLPVWHAAPQMQYLQFPWRWLQVASVISACLVAMALSRGGTNAARVRLPMLVSATLIVIGSTWYCARSFTQPCDEQDRVAGQLAAFYSGSGVEGTDEYTARGADNSAVFQDLPQVRLVTRPDAEEPRPDAGDNPEWPGASEGAIDAASGMITPMDWQAETKRIAVNAKQPAYAVLALMDYPNWKVLVNGKHLASRPKREDGLMAIPVAAGASTIQVEWTTSADVHWGRALSFTALMVLAGLRFFRRREIDA